MNTDELPIFWKKLNIIISLIGIIAIPLVVVYVSHSIEKSIKNKELSAKYIEIAVSILKETPKEETKNLRNWAISIVNEHALIKLDKEILFELKNKALFDISNGSIKTLDDMSLSLKSDDSGHCYRLSWKSIPNVSYYSIVRTNSNGMTKELLKVKSNQVQIVSSWYEADPKNNRYPSDWCHGFKDKIALDDVHTLLHADKDGLSAYQVKAISNTGHTIKSSMAYIHNPQHGG
jgi:hypothetical protein